MIGVNNRPKGIRYLNLVSFIKVIHTCYSSHDPIDIEYSSLVHDRVLSVV